jgi:hypothetical protein
MVKIILSQLLVVSQVAIIIKVNLIRILILQTIEINPILISRTQIHSFQTIWGIIFLAILNKTIDTILAIQTQTIQLALIMGASMVYI